MFIMLALCVAVPVVFCCRDEPQHSLSALQFLDVIVRIAHVKYHAMDKLSNRVKALVEVGECPSCAVAGVL